MGPRFNLSGLLIEAEIESRPARGISPDNLSPCGVSTPLVGLDV